MLLPTADFIMMFLGITLKPLSFLELVTHLGAEDI